MKLLRLRSGFQRCIVVKLNLSIRVVIDIYHFGGYFWGTPQNIVWMRIPTVEVDSRTPWRPTQEATHPKWLKLKMKPLHRGFQERCINLVLSAEFGIVFGGCAMHDFGYCKIPTTTIFTSSYVLCRRWKKLCCEWRQERVNHFCRFLLALPVMT
jgi:hypothetical protein